MAIKIDPSLSIPNQKSSADVWIQWHKDLKIRYGKKAANSLWLSAWEKRKNSNANTTTLREYLKAHGIELESSGLSKIADAGLGFADSVGELFQMGRVTAMVVGVAIFVPVVILLVNVARKPVETLRAAGSARTGGLVQ